VTQSTTSAQPAVDIYDELRPLFYPRSVAVIGVSQDSWKPGTTMLRSLLGFGFSGPIYPVGATEFEMQGIKVYPSLLAAPGPVDLALCFVPARTLSGTLRDCRQKGVRAVVVFTSGFGETGTESGKALEAEVARELDGSFRMVGPNCLGVYSPGGGLTQHPGRDYPRVAGDISFLAQSGGMSEDVIWAAPASGFRLNKVVSYGNAVDLNEADLLEYMGADPSTRAVGMYIEGPRDGRRFAEVLRMVSAVKPVVVWKGGLSPQGAAAASSHTGSLAGSLRVWEALLRQAGAVRVESLEEMLDTLAAFHFLPDQADVRVGYVCAGGGNGVVGSDACCRAGLQLPSLTARTRDTIASLLPPVGSSAENPIDTVSPFPSSGVLKGILESVAASGEVRVIILDKIFLSPELRRLRNLSERLRQPDDLWLSELPIQIRDAYGLPVVVVLRANLDPNENPLVEAESTRLRHKYQEAGIAVFPTAERAFRAIGHVVAYHRRRGERLISEQAGE
jgi:acyl-CoA synthetase (NDP forming)